MPLPTLSRDTTNVRTLLLAGLTLTSPLAFAETITWPDLPSTCFVSGRSATSQDVDTGCAAFLINVKGQAEENGDVKAVGYKELGTGQLGAALLREVRLLGTQKPI
jgi:hypothetical protein